MSILNVSGRTDIVAFYSKWFINRINEGFFDVRNPFYRNLVNRIYLEDIDLIVFCTKNPLPIIPYLDKIKKPIYFMVTLTGYNKDIEPNLPDKKLIIEGIKEISKKLGKNNVVLRYDPILLNDKYDINYHIKAFDKLIKSLKGYINEVIVSFIDDYKNVRKNESELNYKKELNESDYENIGLSFSKIASENGISVKTCGEDRTLWEYGFTVGDCLSKEKAFELTNKKYPIWPERKDKNCHCVKMIDIGAYNTCPHLCKYCYANYSEDEVSINYQNHFDDSTMLIGRLNDNDIIKKVGK